MQQPSGIYLQRVYSITAAAMSDSEKEETSVDDVKVDRAESEVEDEGASAVPKKRVSDHFLRGSGRMVLVADGVPCSQGWTMMMVGQNNFCAEIMLT